MRDHPGNPLRRAIAWLILIFLLAPVIVVFPVAVTDNRYLSFPSHGISSQYFRKLVTDPDWLASAARSMAVASVSACLATLVGGLCAFACWQMSGRLPALIRGLVLLPLIVPPIVIALALNRTWIMFGMFDTYVGVVVAHVLMALPYVFICVTASLALFDAKLIQAARSLGSSRLQLMRMIVVPLITPGLLSGALFAFIASWDEIVILLFITGRGVVLLPRKMLQGIQDDIDPTIAAVAAILVVFTTIGVILAAIYRKRQVTVA
jgi:putative spermidine/putrescine transport system permease protein